MLPRIGDRLPEPHYRRVWVAGIRVPRTRQCESCEHEWATVEIPIFRPWTGERADHCPAHPDEVGKVVNYVSPQAVDTGGHRSAGVLEARSYGGYYRRYRCKNRECRNAKGVKTVRDARKKRVRWSTMEVLAAGVVCANVTTCPKCQGLGKTVWKAA